MSGKQRTFVNAFSKRLVLVFGSALRHSECREQSPIPASAHVNLQQSRSKSEIFTGLEHEHGQQDSEESNLQQQ
jgi:hypothetical protein